MAEAWTDFAVSERYPADEFALAADADLAGGIAFAARAMEFVARCAGVAPARHGEADARPAPSEEPLGEPPGEPVSDSGRVVTPASDDSDDASGE